MVEVHEDDVFGVVLDAEFALGVVHDVVDAVEGPGLDLLGPEVDLQAPEDEALLLLFGLLEEDVYHIIDCRRNSQQFFIPTHRVGLIEFLFYKLQVFDGVDFKAAGVKYPEKGVFQKTHELDSFLDLQLAGHRRGILQLNTVLVETYRGFAQRQKNAF